jgi:hypothetical protein
MKKKEAPMTRMKVTLLFAAVLIVQPLQLLAQKKDTPPLKWAGGTITQMLVQPKESYYTFFVRDAEGAMTLVRLCDPETSAAGPVTASDPLFDVLRGAFFRGDPIEVGYRPFGYDSQSGSPRNCVDRVSLTHD